MSIVSSVHEYSVQVDGSKHVVVRYYDQDGKEYMICFFVAVGVDVDSIIAGRIAAINEQLAQSELRQIVET